MNDHFRNLYRRKGLGKRYNHRLQAGDALGGLLGRFSGPQQLPLIFPAVDSIEDGGAIQQRRA